VRALEASPHIIEIDRRTSRTGFEVESEASTISEVSDKVFGRGVPYDFAGKPFRYCTAYHFIDRLPLQTVPKGLTMNYYMNVWKNLGDEWR